MNVPDKPIAAEMYHAVSGFTRDERYPAAPDSSGTTKEVTSAEGMLGFTHNAAFVPKYTKTGESAARIIVSIVTGLSEFFVCVVWYL